MQSDEHDELCVTSFILTIFLLNVLSAWRSNSWLLPRSLKRRLIWWPTARITPKKIRWWCLYPLQRTHSGRRNYSVKYYNLKVSALFADTCIYESINVIFFYFIFKEHSFCKLCFDARRNDLVTLVAIKTLWTWVQSLFSADSAASPLYAYLSLNINPWCDWSR